MNDRINIKKVNIQFAMDSEEMAFDLYASWSSFFESSFLGIINKVLKRFNRNDQVLSIETLELNLGSVPRNHFHARFPLLLEEKLEERMLKLILTGNSGEIRKVSKSLSLFKAVTWYLIHGYYPWSVDPIPKNFNLLFIELLSEYTKEMAQFLRTYGQSHSMRRRLILQLQDIELQQLVSSVNPTESDFIIAYFNRLINEHTRKKITIATVKEHRDASWEVILAYLLVQKSGHFNRKTFVEQTIHELAAHYGLAYNKLLHFLTDVVSSMIANTKFHSELSSILSELREDIGKDSYNKAIDLSTVFTQIDIIIKSRTVPAVYKLKELMHHLKNEDFRIQLSEQYRYSEIRELSEITGQHLTKDEEKRIAAYYFNLVLEANSTQNIRRLIPIVRENETTDGIPTPSFHAELRQQLKQPQSRRKLISQLDELQIQALVKWLVPGEERFVISYAEMLDKQNERNAFEGHTGGEFKQLKWEFILTVLLETTDSSFNRKAFVYSVISMLAAHYNLTVYQLLQFIYHPLVNQFVLADQELMTIISELYFEEKEKKQVRLKINLFDKELKDEFYFSLLSTFIQTGTLKDTTLASRLYIIMEYLEVYRTDLLERLAEELKKGFLLTDYSTIPHHQALYRKIILWVVQHYQLQLPGERKIKSLFDHLAEDQFKAVPVSAYKTMLLALLTNDTTLYKTAWDTITSETISAPMKELLSRLPEELVLRFLFEPGLFEKSTDRTSSSRAIAEQIFSSRDSVKQLIEAYRIDPSVATRFQKIIQQLPPLFIYRGIIRLYPSQAEDLKQLFRWMAERNISFRGKDTAPLLADILDILVNTRENLLWQCIQVLQSSVKRNHGENQTSTDYFIKWLVLHMGENSSIEEVIKIHFHPLAYSRFNELLSSQPELIRQQVETGILSKDKITQWLKTASLLLQLQWMQTIAAPYHLQTLNNAFLFIQWLQNIIAEIAGVSFNRGKALELLLEFCSGNLQNCTEQQLYSKLFNATIVQANDKQKEQINTAMNIKAANHGKSWEQKLQHLIPADMNSPKGTDIQQPIVTDDIKTEVLEEIFINNAGLVLCNPFLPRLFSLLQLTDNGTFTDRKANERAVLLLQYMLFENTAFPEHLMVLNKLLCGLETGIPVDCHIEVTQTEKETLEQMLKGMIQHWNKLGNTSPKGLIDSFLIREGKLEQHEEAWHLKIEQRGYDMLLDSLPWSYSPIKYSWMKKPIYVKWR